MKSVMVSIPIETQRAVVNDAFINTDGAEFVFLCSPTKHCFLLSHSGAALTPLETRAKNAFLTCQTVSGSAKSRNE